MIDVCNRVAGWNALRYDRDYDHDLTVSLLREEYEETVAAEAVVDALDGLCDMIYVALGALWKCNMPNEEFFADEQEAIAVVENMVSLHLQPIYLIPAILAAHEFDNEFSVALAMHSVILLARAQMIAMGLSREQHIEALNIVCDSNDTKAVAKTESHIKANISKGAEFVSPEPRLQVLLDNRAVQGVL